jgi:hypothetical protein
MMMNKDNDHPELQVAFQQLRDAMKDTATPNKVEQNIMHAFSLQQRMQQNAQQKSQRQSSNAWLGLGQWLAPGAAIAASVGMVTWLMLGGAVLGVKNTTIDTAENAADAPFIALQSLEQIALEPNPRLIETTVPKMLFASMGMAVSPEMASESVRAEMLVSAAGQPLALRLSRP